MVGQRGPLVELPEGLVPMMAREREHRAMDSFVEEIREAARIGCCAEHADVDLGTVSAGALTGLVESTEPIRNA